jgi:AraC family transcriptional activator of tynA and feaB
MRAETFSTQGQTDKRGARAFQTTLADLFSVDLALTATNDQPFVSQMLAYRSPRLHVARLGFSAHRTFYAGSSRARASNLLVSIHREGEVRVSQSDRDARIRPGDIFIIDPSRPFEIETGAIDTYSIYLPRAQLQDLAPELESATARAISSASGSGAVFRALLEGVFAAAPGLEDTAADRLADSFPPVLAAAIANVPGGASPAQLKLSHRQRIRSFAREHLHDPDLDIDRIARGVNLSQRYVHELFCDQPTTLMRWIWAERIERCREDLARPALMGRPIGEIAYTWGFGDLAHFSRAFRERYGQPPRAFRQSVLAERG